LRSWHAYSYTIESLVTYGYSLVTRAHVVLES